MRYRAVIFDLDGTLIDSERHNMLAWRSACAQHGYELTDAFYHGLIGLSRVNADAQISTQFVGCDVQVLRAARKEHFYATWHLGVPLKPGLDEALEWLSSRGIPVAVATSSWRGEADTKLKLSGLTEHFPVVVCGDEVAAAKPEPDLFLEAARLLGVPPGECLAVEDSPWGVVAAVRAGMDVAFIPDLVDADAETAGRARVLRSLADLTTLF